MDDVESDIGDRTAVDLQEELDIGPVEIGALDLASGLRCAMFDVTVLLKRTNVRPRKISEDR
jgi:hypothetical protein